MYITTLYREMNMIAFADEPALSWLRFWLKNHMNSGSMSSCNYAVI